MRDVRAEERGLAMAHERRCFYELIDGWAEEYKIETMLEGPIDGTGGIAGVHGAGLGRRAVKVVSAVPSEEHARIARAVYASCGYGPENVTVVVAGEAEVSSLPRSDMVVCYQALSLVSDWRRYLVALSTLARKVLVVAVPNPAHWGVSAMTTLARARGSAGAPESWRTDALAPELWQIGRVRAHTYFDASWWPGLAMLSGRSAGAARESKASDAFVYGPDRWPYFGGPGFDDELGPALRKRRSFEGASAKVIGRMARMHAFVVDLRPRTPRERRRLITAGA